MSDEKIVTEPTSTSIRMRLDAWTYEDYLEFTTAMRKAQFRKAFDLAGLLIDSWNRKEPFSTQAIKALPSLEGIRILRTVMDNLDSWAKELDTSEVTLNLDKWTLEDLLAFTELNGEADARKTINRVKQVASVAGYDAKNIPTMTQGVLMIRAVHDAVSAILSGKN